MGLLGYLLQAIGLFTILIFYVIPVLMLPFVNELPYLHQITLWERTQISFFIFSLSYFLIMIGAKPRNRKVATSFINDTKGLLMTFCGIFGFIISGAYFSGNILGLLILYTLPTQPFLSHVQVDQVKYQGSKSKSLYLSLHSEEDGKIYYLTLAKKMFDYPSVNIGDKMILKGQENIFGIYINNYEFD